MRFLSKSSGSSKSNVIQKTSLKMVACFDIDLDVIKVSLTVLKKENFEIIKCIQRPVKFQSSDEYLLKANDLIKACQKALSQATKGLSAKLSGFSLALGGGFIQAITQRDKIRRSNPQVALDVDELKQFMQNNQVAAQQKALTKMEFNQQIHNVDLVALDRSLIGFTLDSQLYPKLIGQSANFVSLGFYHSFIDQRYRQLVQDLKVALKLPIIKLASKPFAVGQGWLRLQKAQATKDSGLILHMEADTTYVTIVHGGILFASQMFNIGWWHFQAALNRDLEEGNQSIDITLMDDNNAFDLSQLSKSQRQAVLKSINQTLKVWLKALALVLEDLNLTFLPHQIYLTGYLSNFDLASQTLTKLNWFDLGVFKDKPTVQTLNFNQLSSRLPAEIMNRGSLAVNIGLSQLSWDKFHNCDYYITLPDLYELKIQKESLKK
ncbi:MAG: hypothetical protein OXF49_00410 [Candidatus Saccharibacteria bacterium]|nr:hypothetical protein [Candidatus Saccharibacteria bacterium]